MLTIDWAGHAWELLPDKALHWPARKTVIVADLHFGKGAAFRHHGVPVPAGSTARDLARLSALIERTGCTRLTILGDFLHARHGRADDTMQLIGDWRGQHAALDITLVRGNHDVHAGDPPLEWRIGCCDHLEIAGIGLWHDLGNSGRPTHPLTPSLRGRGKRAPTIAGHVHPCVHLNDLDGSSMRAPCFVFAPHAALLPAFGSFTGTHAVRPREGDRVFAVGPGTVVEVEGVRA